MVTGADLVSALRRLPLRPVEVAGVTIYVRSLSGAERKLLVQRARDNNPLQSNELVALCACNEAGEPLFTLEEATELDTLDGGSLDRIGNAVIEVSGLSAKAEADAAKN